MRTGRNRGGPLDPRNEEPCPGKRHSNAGHFPVACQAAAIGRTTTRAWVWDARMACLDRGIAGTVGIALIRAGEVYLHMALSSARDARARVIRYCSEIGSTSLGRGPRYRAEECKHISTRLQRALWASATTACLRARDTSVPPHTQAGNMLELCYPAHSCRLAATRGNTAIRWACTYRPALPLPSRTYGSG